MGLPVLGTMKLGKAIMDIGVGALKSLLPNAQQALADAATQSPSKFVETLGNMMQTPEAIAKAEEAAQSHEDLLLAYEGGMEDLPEWGKNLRSSVRPILTYAFNAIYIFLVVYGIATGILGYQVEAHLAQVFAMLDKLSFRTLVFMIDLWWFGDRAVQSWLGRIR